MVLVSVCMSCYNHDKYVAEAVESVLNQTFSDFEFIIVDDYSTDNSRTILKKYSQTDKRIKLLLHHKNMGIAKTANDCIKEATGEFIAFIGSDDVWCPNKLEQQVRLAKKFHDKILWCDGEVIDGQGTATGQKVTQYLLSPLKKSGDIFEELLREDFVFGQGVFFKTEFAKQMVFEEAFKYVNDHLFFINLAKTHEFLFSPQILAKYRVHDRNATKNHHKTWLKERITLRTHLIEKFSSEISPEALSDLLYKIGHGFSGLGEKRTARKFYFKALRVAPFHTSSALYLILALTNGEGVFGNFLSSYYRKVVSLLNFKTAY